MTVHSRVELEFENVGFSIEVKTGVLWEKPLRVENQQQTQLTYDAGLGNRTRDTLVGDVRSHHCVIPAPQDRPIYR